MSSSSIDRQQSPTIQTEEHGEDEGDGRRSPPEQTPASVKRDASLQQMNYPIDQDLFHSGPSSLADLHSKPSDQAQDTQQTYPEPEPEASHLPPPDFRPFFTLIADPATGEHYHPSVHYIFSDDDTEILTSAALDAISKNSTDVDDQGPSADDDEDEEAGVEERVVIVEIASDGKSIANISSLSKEWQALKTDVGAAPSMGDATAEEGGERGLMLKISGTEAAGGLEMGKGEDLDGLVRKFGEVLAGLDEVVGKEQAVGEGEC